MSHSFPKLESVDSIVESLATAGYICNEQIATVVYLAAALEKPILVEGPPGVGKTELAKSCAQVTGAPLVRLQCYEGLDESKAIYEWKYGKQLLYTQLLKTQLSEVMEGAQGYAHRSSDCTVLMMSSSQKSFWSQGHYSRQSMPRVVLCFWWTRLTRQISSLNRYCLKCSPTFRFHT